MTATGETIVVADVGNTRIKLAAVGGAVQHRSPLGQ